MRVLNDREDVKPRPEVFGPWAVPLYAMLCAFGMSTFFLSPMTLILAHRRLDGFWPKVTAVLGALLALVVLEASMPVVMLSFVFGLFVADGVTREVPFWKLFGQSFLIGTGCLFLGLAALASSSHVGLTEYWVQSMTSAVEFLKQSPLASEWNADLLKGILIYEGPFLLLGGSVLSFWVSIGMAAHFEWLPAPHPYSGPSLRETVRGAAWQSAVFLALFAATLVAQGKMEHIVGGLFRLGSMAMFVFGTVTISRHLALRNVTRGIRGLIYSVLVCIGFYAVVGIGVLSPWTFRRKNRAEVLPVGSLEEAI